MMLRAERNTMGKTQAKLAVRLGMRRQTISDLKNGKNVGSYIIFAMLAALRKGGLSLIPGLT